MLVGAHAGGVSTLNPLSSSPDCEIVTVLAPYDRPSGAQLAAHFSSTAFATDVLMYGVDIGLSVQCPYIVCTEVLAAEKIGWFNHHGGPLPRYAGAKPTQAAISRGEREFGVTLHWMTPKIDAGAIVTQTMFPVLPSSRGNPPA